MIRLPKLFKRNSQSDVLERGSAGLKRTSKRIAPRSLQRSFETQDEALTEDPEQQRARHRLIGAAVLVLIAVVGLPRILDNKPKAVSNDIAVNIVTSLPIPVTSNPAPEIKPAEKAEPAAVLDTTPKEKEVVLAKPVPAATPIIEVKAVAATSKTAGLGLVAGEEVVAGTTKPKVDAPSKPAVTSTSKFVLQIGAFASEERAKGWIAKMKDQKIPNYVLNKNGTDGSKLYVLRAGPFPDKESAEAAEKKIKAMGLTPRLVETGAP